MSDQQQSQYKNSEMLAPWHLYPLTPDSPGRKKLFSAEARKGSLHYLPSRAVTAKSFTTRRGLDETFDAHGVSLVGSDGPVRKNVFGHFVVILSRPLKDPGTVFFVTLTTLRNKPLESQEQFTPKQLVPLWTPTVPVHPMYSPDFGTYYAPLRFQGNRRMPVDVGYVVASEVYKGSWRDLCCYSHRGPGEKEEDKDRHMEWELEDKSLEQLVDLCKLLNSEWKVDEDYDPPLSWQHDYPENYTR